MSRDHELLTEAVRILDEVRGQLADATRLLIQVRNLRAGLGGDWRDDIPKD